MRLKPRTFTLTAVAYERRRIFQRAANADLLIATILRYRDGGRFLLHSFVVMPDQGLKPQPLVRELSGLKGQTYLRGCDVGAMA